MKTKALLLSLLLAVPMLVRAAFPAPTTVNPADGTTFASPSEFNDKILMYFPGMVTVDKTTMPTLTNTNTGEVLTANLYELWQLGLSMNAYIVRVGFYPTPTENGLYKLVIPEGTLTYQGETNPELVYQYQIGSVVEGPTYKQVDMVSCIPGQNTALADLGGAEFHFTTTDNSQVNFLDWEFCDVTGDTEDGQPVIIRKNNRNRYTLNGNMLASNTQNEWTSDINFFVGGEEPLWEGREYEMRVRFFNMGLTPADVTAGRKVIPAPYEYEPTMVCEYTVKIKGARKPYEFSEVTYTISPDPEEYVIENAALGVFTITFSDPVDVNTFIVNRGNGSTGVAGTTTKNEAGDVWILTIDPSEIITALSENSDIAWSWGANDMQGRRIRGNDDASRGAESLTTYNTRCDNSTPRLQLVSPIADENGNVTELTQIIVTNASHIEMRKGNRAQTSKARLLTRFGEEIVVFEDFEINPENNSQAIFTLDQPLTDNGSYVFMLPSDILMIMNGGESGYSYNLAFDQLFNVDNGKGVQYTFMPTNVEPGDKSTVESLSQVTLTFPEDVCLNPGREKARLMKENFVVETVDVDFSWDDYSLAIVKFAKTYTKETDGGNYTLVIPQESVVNPAYESSEGTEGLANPELTYNFTVGTPKPGAVGNIDAEAAAENGDVYGVDGVLVLRNASAADVQALPAGLYIHNGKKVVVK